MLSSFPTGLSRPLSQLSIACFCLSVVISVTTGARSSAQSPPAGLQEALAQEPAAQLIADAEREGDAARGAALFYQSSLGCAKCHQLETDSRSLGPNLATEARDQPLTYLVESILQPSATIREPYRTMTLVRLDGRTHTGVVAKESASEVTLIDAAVPDQLIRVATNEIEERHPRTESLMPVGLANGLANRQQFLDLLRFLLEIRAGGPNKAAEYRPAQSLVAFQLPEYESHVDHRALIAGWDDESLQRGAKIYSRVCANCHGTPQQEGSLPTSLKFASGKFKHGADPYTMYRTLTHGFGLMVAQHWMVPRQKYYVIHYIREMYLREHNPTQYVEVTPRYLAALPTGDTLGPEPVDLEPWAIMDYGSTLIGTYEFRQDATNIAQKGIAVRLDEGAGGVARGRAWMIFDHDTLRVAGAWVGDRFIDWQGIHFDGAHGVHPHVVGDIAFENPTGPGWAEPATGSWEDVRIVGRDGRRYGPLPRSWAHYRGLYQHGGQALIHYTVGATKIWEVPGLITLNSPHKVAAASASAPLGKEPTTNEPVQESSSAVPAAAAADSVSDLVFTRHLRIDAHQEPLRLRVARVVSGAELSPVSLANLSSQAGGNRAERSGQLIAVAVDSDPGTPGTDPSAQGHLLAGVWQAAGSPSPTVQWSVTASGDLVCEFAPQNARQEYTVWVSREEGTEGTPRAATRSDAATRSAADDRSESAERSEPKKRSDSLSAHVVHRLEQIAAQMTTADYESLMAGGPSRWPERLATQVQTPLSTGPFHVDILQHPEQNPWNCRQRLTGIDFYPDGNRAAVCSWDGNIYWVDGLLDPAGHLTWRRIASGLFQPLGIKVINQVIYLTCRDQLVRLHDLNGDDEIDFYENVNNDHQVTEHFHEFAMGLQTDAAGNFYYAKSARHALPAVVPHHGTLIKISADGERTEILARGFRAANGVCLNDDGSFIVTDQEGHWNPKNRINWVRPGGFYGNMFGYHDVTDSSNAAMEQPVCWITNDFDRSPAELLWVKSPAWGPFQGSLLNLSYGYGRIFVVPHETVTMPAVASPETGAAAASPTSRSQVQGGMVQLPIPDFPTGLIRGRFSPVDGHLYACGMFAWAGSREQPGGLYRVRYSGEPAYLPIGLHAHRAGLDLVFSDPIEGAQAADLSRYHVEVWGLERSANYGSRHVDQHPLEVTHAEVLPDGRTLRLTIADMQPTWCMEVRYQVESSSGKLIRGTLHNTVHALGDVPASSN